MPAVSREEYLRRSTGQDTADEQAEQLDRHLEEQPDAPESPHPGGARPYSPPRGFGSRRRGPHGGQHPAARPARREEYGSQEELASPGTAGVAAFPDALPGSHHYAEKDVVTRHAPLDVGPAVPFYSRGNAHGVAPESVPHGGRPSPAPHEQMQISATREISHEEIAEPPDPVPVYVVEKSGGTHPLLRAAVRRVQVNAPGGDPVLLIGKDPERTSVRLLNEATAAAVQSLSGFGSVTNPTAGQTIASVALPAGTWQLQLLVQFAGTLTAADEDNYQLTLAGVNLGQQTANIETASSAPNPPRMFTVSVPAGGATAALAAIENA